MKNVAIAFLALLLAPAIVCAQNSEEGSWVNQDLINKKVSPEQYKVIGRGHSAQCQAQGRVQADQAVGQQIICNPNDISFTCTMQATEQMNKRKELYQDLFLGCMAEKGWMWVEKKGK